MCCRFIDNDSAARKAKALLKVAIHSVTLSLRLTSPPHVVSTIEYNLCLTVCDTRVLRLDCSCLKGRRAFVIALSLEIGGFDCHMR